MNPHAALAVVQSTEDVLDLSLPERKFCEEFFSGECADNATRSYMVAWPNSNVNTAGSAGPTLLKDARIQKYLGRLREQAIGASTARLIPWTQLLPRAQAIIVATAEGRLRSRLQYEAAMYLVNRVIGTPVSTSEVHVSDQSRITGAIKLLGQRLKGVEVV